MAVNASLPVNANNGKCMCWAWLWCVRRPQNLYKTLMYELVSFDDISKNP
jgi:hypothetical protein